MSMTPREIVSELDATYYRTNRGETRGGDRVA